MTVHALPLLAAPCTPPRRRRTLRPIVSDPGPTAHSLYDIAHGRFELSCVSGKFVEEHSNLSSACIAPSWCAADIAIADLDNVKCFEKSPPQWSPIASPVTPSTTSKGSPLVSDGDESPSKFYGETPEWRMESGMERGDVLNAPLLEVHSIDSDFQEPSQRVHWEGFFIVFPVYCAYASFFGLQRQVKCSLGISDSDIVGSQLFSSCISFLFLFLSIFRTAHMIVFSLISPRSRVFVAMLLLAVAMLLVAGPILTLGYHNPALVCLAYGLGGIGIGTFDPNFLNCLTPLGKRTKLVAISGIPAGINALLVGGFFAMAPPFEVPARCIFLFVAALLFNGMALMFFRIPCHKQRRMTRTDTGTLKFWADMRKFQSWGPQMWQCIIAWLFNMVCATAFNPGVVLYVYDKPTVAMTQWIIWDRDHFIAAFNAFGFFGGMAGRWLSFSLRPQHPLLYCCVNLVGILLITRWVPLLAPVGAFLIMLADGLIYGSITRHIDERISNEFNLTAITTWLFFGDVGSIVGQNLIMPIHAWALRSG